MLSVTEAVKVATSSLVPLFPKAEKVRVEEVELSEDDQYWLITLSFVDPDREWSPLSSPGGFFSTRPREYRVVRLNKATGDVRSIKMREPTNV